MSGSFCSLLIMGRYIKESVGNENIGPRMHASGRHRKTIRKHLAEPTATPTYEPRLAHSSELDPFKGYME